VPALRLRPPLRATPTVHAFGAHGWPFLAAPLLHGAQFPNMIPVGILGVDGFELVARSHSGKEKIWLAYLCVYAFCVVWMDLLSATDVSVWFTDTTR